MLESLPLSRTKTLSTKKRGLQLIPPGKIAVRFSDQKGQSKKYSSCCFDSHQAGDNQTPSGRSSAFTSTAENIQALFEEVKSLCAGLIELRTHNDHSLEELGQLPSTRRISELIELQAQIDHSMEMLGRALGNASTE